LSAASIPAEDRDIIPLPLVIGVTGHRDLRKEDWEPLEAQVRLVFAGLQVRYPHTPLVLLSALAEGADRLVARVALENEVRLIVPLPMPRALYEEDFQTEASRDEFNKLLQQAEWWFELPLVGNARDEEVRQQGPARDRQYEQVGAYIVLHSQILIALWDGADTHPVGGTSQIVQFQLHGVPQSYAPSSSPLDEPEKGPVYHIVTPRVKNPTPSGQPFELHILPPANTTHEDMFSEQESGGDRQDGKNGSRRKKRGHHATKYEFDRLLQRLHIFNSDFIHLKPHLTKMQERSKADLFGTIDSATLPPELRGTLDHYANLYAIADSLAIYFRDQTVNTLLFLFRLFFIAVVCLNIFADLGGDLVTLLGDKGGAWLRVLFLLFYLILLFSAYYVWYYRAKKGDYQSKYLDYRALAEGLRVEFFWRLAGVPDLASTHYLRKQKSELDWIRNGMRVADLLSVSPGKESPTALTKASLETQYQVIIKQWVDDQGTWYARAAKRDQKKLQWHERGIQRFFLLGIGLAVVLFLLQFVLLLPPYQSWIKTVSLINPVTVQGLLTDLLIFVMSLALVLAALREGYIDKMAYTEQIKQYQRMSQLFQFASQRLKDALKQESLQEAERLIRELGEEALEENGDWVILHRTRQIDVPM
jgi:hypothetical protein